MKKKLYKTLFDFEDHYWWFIAMRKIKIRVLRDYHSITKKTKILDAGCGTGGFLKEIQSVAQAHGIDTSEEAINYCKKRNLKRIKKANIEKMPFKNNYFDIVTLNDVLYHKSIRNKAKPIKECLRVLKKDGVLLISDIGMNIIKSKHDEAFEVNKRFSKKELINLVQTNGFTIKKATYTNSLLFPIISLVRITQKIINKKTTTDFKKLPKIINITLAKILSFEYHILKRTNLPIGTSILIVAKKR